MSPSFFLKKYANEYEDRYSWPIVFLETKIEHVVKKRKKEMFAAAAHLTHSITFLRERMESCYHYHRCVMARNKRFFKKKEDSRPPSKMRVQPRGSSSEIWGEKESYSSSRKIWNRKEGGLNTSISEKCSSLFPTLDHHNNNKLNSRDKYSITWSSLGS